MPEHSDAELVDRDEVTVMFTRVADEQSAITRGWAEFEQAVGLPGRKFYGAADAGGFHGEGTGEYRICAQLREEDDPAALGLEVGTLPGGQYADPPGRPAP